MALTDDQKKLLDSPLDPERIKGREGPRGANLSYLSQDDIKRTANRIFGFGEWSYEPIELVFIGEEEVARTVKRNGVDIEQKGLRVAYRASVKVWLTGRPETTYTDWGYGEDVSYMSALQQHELAVKEAVSDAVKRALVPFGDQFGLGLYSAAAEARRGGRAPARGRQQQAEPPKPATLNESDLRAIHAERSKLDVSEDDLKRIARFISDMPSLASMKDFPRSMRGDLVKGIQFFASDPAAADQQLAGFEAEAGITSAVAAPQGAADAA